MPSVIDHPLTAYKGGSAILLARVVGDAAVPVKRADIASIRYTVALIDPDDEDEDMPVSGHDAVALDVAAVLFDVLQTSGVWTVDGVGYNFRHALDVSAAQAFAHAGREYRVIYDLVPVVGQPIKVRFRVRVI